MHVDVRGIEVAVGERARESCSCGEVAAGSVMVDGGGGEAGGAVPWELTAVEAGKCRVQSLYLHRNDANG